MRGIRWVSIVDDDVSVRDTLKGWLARRVGYRLRSEHALGEDALKALSELKPDVLILDVRMGRMDGLECLDKLRPVLRRSAIVMHTAFGGGDVLHHALTGGANGYVQKDGQSGTLLEAIAHATPNGFFLATVGVIPLKAASIELLASRLRISKREREFLRLLAADFGNKDIANELHLGRQYVNNRLPRLYRKLGVHTPAGAVTRAMQLGLISVERTQRHG
jgi:DNA-binding NarL/FixJ family response regulator